MINRADYSRASSTTAIGTGSTSIAGLSKEVVNGGVYKFEAFMQLVNVGSPTNVNFCVTGPSTTACNFAVERGAVGTFRSDPYTAFAAASAGTAIVSTWAKIQGTFVASANGTIQVVGIRVAGTSATVQIGGYLECERIG